MQLKRITLCVVLSFVPSVYAADSTSLPEVEVTAGKLQSLPSSSSVGLDASNLLRKKNHTSDSAQLLDGQPGVSLYSAGGVSSLPVIHGMADDRVRVKLDGMDLISACANHMNSPLSYIDPANVSSVNVFAGITPVSVGGDSIGGTIQVDSAVPEFAKSGEGTLHKGQIGAFYRSNNAAQGGNLSATIAGEDVSVRYTGSTVRAGNYKAGAALKAAGISTGSLANVYVAGDEIASTQYQSNNQALDFGLRRDNHLVELKLGLQKIPYQGFANQRMDMLNNDSQQINLNYTGQYDWGVLQARAYNEHTRHYMNFLAAKQTTLLGMPMDTDGKNTGLNIKGDVVLSERDILRVGSEYQRYRMSDWWNPVAATGMMGGGTFQNINNGQRDRMAVFAEIESRWNAQWLSQFGLRSETVTMNTGTVQGYNTMMYGNPLLPTSIPGAFNAANHQKTDNNIDLTALARFTPDAQKTFEFGFAQKTRSPNLYERFAWSTNNTMVMGMNTWFGDGNGYVGNLNLKPEVARTLSGSMSLHGVKEDDFEIKIAPYYTYVQNYIDAARCAAVTGTACTALNLTVANNFAYLQFVNQSARLYGADVSARAPLAQGEYGSLAFNGVLSYVNGKNVTTGDNLYHIMPLNAKLGVEQHIGSWTNAIEAKLVSAKTQVSATRNELKTGGYTLLNLRSSYEWKQVRFDVGVDNLLNRFYADPLGGSYLGQRVMTYGTALPGMGRSINAGVTVKF